jgi:hypothetical protein
VKVESKAAKYRDMKFIIVDDDASDDVSCAFVPHNSSI